MQPHEQNYSAQKRAEKEFELQALVRRRGTSRLIFSVLFYAIALHLPGPVVPLGIGRFGHWFRGFCARRMLHRMGQNVNIAKQVRIGSGYGLSIGNNSNIGWGSWLQGTISIGSHVMMGPEVVIISDNHAFNDTTIPMTEQGMSESKPIIIEDDVWIGTRSIILPGVCIGTGSIIGAGSVVTKNIPPMSVAVGNPAKVVRKRTSNETEAPNVN